MVAEALAGPGTRGARLGAHGKRAARRAKGLEGALVDRERSVVTALDRSDTLSYVGQQLPAARRVVLGAPRVRKPRPGLLGVPAEPASA